VLGQKNNLPAVIAVMRHLPVDGLHHRMRLTANRHCPRQVGLSQRLQRAKHAVPTSLPRFHQRIPRRERIIEFKVPTPVRLLPIAGQKIREPGPHVASHMFHNHRDRIRFLVEEGHQLFISQLRHGPLRKALVVAEQAERIAQVRSG